METITSPLENNAALLDDIHSENVSGNWYVSDECISCDLCENNMPKVFRPASDRSQHIVYLQPGSEDELEETREAAEDCPAEAILERES